MVNVSLANSTNTLVGIKKCVVCQNGITKSVSGDTCSFECGKKYALSISKNVITKTNANTTFKHIYYDQDVNYIDLIKTAIVQLKVAPQESKVMFFNNKIIPLIEQINGDKAQWNAMCSHIKKEYYGRLEYRFIIEIFASVGVRVKK